MGSHSRNISSGYLPDVSYNLSIDVVYNLNSDRLFSHLNYKLVPLRLLYPTESSLPLDRGLLPGADPCRSGSHPQPLWSGFLSPQRNQHTQRLRPLKENTRCCFKPWELICISNNELAVQSQDKHTQNHHRKSSPDSAWLLKLSQTYSSQRVYL